MLSPEVQRAIEQIHGAPPKLVFEFAGAGSMALYWLHSVAGSSRTVLEATDRYAPASLGDLLGALPEKFVSQETAEAMANAAFRRAQRVSDGGTPSFGLACTATIATDRVKRGDHGVWVAVRTADTLRAYGLVLEKGSRDRAGEETLVSLLVLQAIGEASGIGTLVELPLQPAEHLDQHTTPVDDPLLRLLAGQAQSVTVLPDGQRIADAPVNGALLSGSFNPLHYGHEQLLGAAASLLGVPAAFELPIRNADKPPLSYGEIERRLAQFRGRYTVVLGHAPLFVDKADRYPGCTFVIGYDTAVRLVDQRYYGDEAGRDAALAHIRDRGCRFLVAGRVQNGEFCSLADVSVPVGFADLFLPLPEQVFRADVSSSAIRKQFGQ